MTNMFTAAVALSESPLIRFLAGITLLVGAPFAYRWACREVAHHVSRALDGPFATTRAQIAALETTEERR